MNYTQAAPLEDMERLNMGDTEQTPVNTTSVSLDDLMARIRHHVLVNRRRVRHIATI